MRKALLALVAGAMLAAPAALAQQRGTGLVYLEPERYRSIPLAPPVALTGVPAEFDMSKDFPTPGDQGQQGSCVGWAVGYALKSFQERRERNWTNWDDTKRMSPAFVYNQVKVGGCGDGARIADALGLLSSDGAAAWTDQPYRLEDCDQLPSALTKQNAAMNRIAGWFRVNPQDITVVKAHLAAGMPIVIGMGVDQSFQQLEGAEVWTGNPGSRADGHAMVIVGYSDKRNAVKVINSWGTGWADKGFGWIDYEAFRRAVREAYVAQDVVLPVGVAQRKEHPYAVKTGSYGPEVFGLQLGNTKSEAQRKLTRDGKWDRISLTNGESRDRLSVEASQIGIKAEFWFDQKHDFLDRIETSRTIPAREGDAVLDAAVGFLNRLPPNRLAQELLSTFKHDDDDRFRLNERACQTIQSEIALPERPSTVLVGKLREFVDALQIDVDDLASQLGDDNYGCSSEPSYDRPVLIFSAPKKTLNFEGKGISYAVEIFPTRMTELQLATVGGDKCIVSNGKFYAMEFSGLWNPSWRADRSKPQTSCKVEAGVSNIGLEARPTVSVVLRSHRESSDFKIE